MKSILILTMMLIVLYAAYVFFKRDVVSDVVLEDFSAPLVARKEVLGHPVVFGLWSNFEVPSSLEVGLSDLNEEHGLISYVNDFKLFQHDAYVILLKEWGDIKHFPYIKELQIDVKKVFSEGDLINQTQVYSFGRNVDGVAIDDLPIFIVNYNALSKIRQECQSRFLFELIGYADYDSMSAFVKSNTVSNCAN